jgi:hypothetical protein
MSISLERLSEILESERKVQANIDAGIVDYCERTGKFPDEMLKAQDRRGAVINFIMGLIKEINNPKKP